MTHQEVVESLAQAKGTNLWEVNLGSPYMKYFYGGSSVQRADVIVIRPSYTNFCLDIYEVKVSRSDFLKDVRSGKYKGYLPMCHRLYFAVIKGLVDKREIPDDVGLIQYNIEKKSWSTIKPATQRDVEIPEQVLLSCLFKRSNILHTVNRSVKTSDQIRLKAMGKRVEEIQWDNIILRTEVKELKEQIIKKT